MLSNTEIGIACLLKNCSVNSPPDLPLGPGLASLGLVFRFFPFAVYLEISFEAQTFERKSSSIPQGVWLGLTFFSNSYRPTSGPQPKRLSFVLIADYARLLILAFDRQGCLKEGPQPKLSELP